MKPGAVVVLLFVLAALVLGIYILSAAAGGSTFAFGGEYISKPSVIAISAVLVVLFGAWFFASRKKA